MTKRITRKMLVAEAEKFGIETKGLTKAEILEKIRIWGAKIGLQKNVLEKPQGRGNLNIRDCDQKPGLKANRRRI